MKIKAHTWYTFSVAIYCDEDREIDQGDSAADQLETMRQLLQLPEGDAGPVWFDDISLIAEATP